jgi:tetratricopeptide (TPR) repeat protein
VRMPEWICGTLRRARRNSRRARRELQQGRADQAQVTATAALLLLEGDPHAHRADVGAGHQILGATLTALHDLPAATTALEKAVDLASGPGSSTSQLVDALTLLGNVDRLQGSYDDAGERLRQAVELADRSSAPPAHRAAAYNALGIWCKDTGRYDEASVNYHRALTCEVDPQMRAALCHNLAVLGAALFGQQRHHEAEPLFQRALEIYTGHYGPQHYEVAVNLGNLAALYSQTGRLQAAESAYLESLRIKTDLLGPMHVDVGRLLNNLALLRERQGHHAAAVHLLDSASLIFDAALGPDHPGTRSCRNTLTKFKKSPGHGAEPGATHRQHTE